MAHAHAHAMSSTSTATEKTEASVPTPAQGVEPVAPDKTEHAPAAGNLAKNAPVLDIPGEDGDLQKLLQHMQGLQHQNAEMLEVLEQMASAKAHELEQILGDKIMPWITQLNIPPELREKVIHGIKSACLKPADCKNYRKMLDLDTNPVMQVMCAAAQAHGEAIKAVEDTRKQLHDASSNAERISRNKASVDESINATTDRLMHSRAGAARVGDKRPHEEVDHDEHTNSKCWASLFESFV